MTDPQPLWSWDVQPIPDQRALTPPTIPGLSLGQPLGAGAMGEVFRAFDAFGREVAVKVMRRRHLSERALARFQREAELLARLDHPGVVSIHTWGETEEVCYLVCELVVGEHFDVAARALDAVHRLELLLSLIQAVGVAHAAGIVHRDLKPSNVIVDGATRQVKVIDFGVSTANDLSRLTQTGAFVGTPLYAPPERFGDPEAGSPTLDVWALGAIGFEALTGRHPYPSATVQGLTARSAAPPRLGSTDVSARVEAVILRALDPDPARRYPDANAMAEAFGRALREPKRRIWWTALRLGAFGAAAIVLGRGLVEERASPSSTPTPAVAPRAPAIASPALPPELRARALAHLAHRAWSDLDLLLAPRSDLPPEFQRWHGLAVLFTRGPDAARGLLGNDTALLEAEALRRGALALSATEPPTRHLDQIRALLLAVETAGTPTDPATLEVYLRAQRAIGRALALALDALPGAIDFPRVDKLLMAAGRLTPGRDTPSLDVLGMWLAFARSGRPAPTARGERALRTNAQRFFAQRPDLSGAAPEIERLAALIEVATQPPRETGLAPDLQARALAALAEQPNGPISRFLRRIALRALALDARNAACAAYRAGKPAQGAQRVGGGVRLALQAMAITPTHEADVMVLAQLELIRGRSEAARRALTRVRSTSPLGWLLRSECDLIEGRFGSRVRLATPKTNLRGLSRRIRLHALILSGALRAEVGLRRYRRSLKGRFQEPPRNHLRWIEWHSQDAFEAVLSGGWWPGRKPAKAR